MGQFYGLDLKRSMWAYGQFYGLGLKWSIWPNLPINGLLPGFVPMGWVRPKVSHSSELLR